MAADSLASEHVVTKLVGNLSLADQPEAILRPEGSAKEESKPAVSPSSESTEAKEGNKKQLDAKDHRPFYPSNNYYGYYYPGQENTNKAWEDQTRFYGMDAADGQYTGAPSENGSLLYYPPGYGYGQNPYNPYNPYIPGGMVGADGQYMGQRPYYPGQFQQTPASRYFPSSPMHPPRQETGSVPASKAHANGISGGKGVSKTTYKDGIKGAESGASLPRNLRPMSQIQLNQQVNGGASHGKDSMQFRKYSCGLNQGKVTMPYANINGMMYKPNPRQRGKFYGYHGNENWNLDGMNEQNRGPRTIRPKSSQDSSEARSSGYGEEQYNLDSFCVDYETAKFFVIKSYSEDDVHQSIKYNVWASTPNGNKKLDGAYQEAQKLSSENKACPVFLFFSVNASGQFCGVAEMIGSVDFEKSMDFWQQDKWNGFFPVKWHLVKDIPNSQFRQIILENNDNKPVTNSRDTQEVLFVHSLAMIILHSQFGQFILEKNHNKPVTNSRNTQEVLFDDCS
eukprot:TRINITY_DN3876_c0_g1_i1.p1 TRINITY_DN3876_c0_g1~~TRINITY_DN3876_c0_g1_i1.p1  ORF type:complete len:508 (-),score=87.61 TRINITY_DN3876_c0_g1_i1:44-1567(-)